MGDYLALIAISYVPAAFGDLFLLRILDMAGYNVNKYEEVLALIPVLNIFMMAADFMVLLIGVSVMLIMELIDKVKGGK